MIAQNVLSWIKFVMTKLVTKTHGRRCVLPASSPSLGSHHQQLVYSAHYAIKNKHFQASSPAPHHHPFALYYFPDAYCARAIEIKRIEHLKKRVMDGWTDPLIEM